MALSQKLQLQNIRETDVCTKQFYLLHIYSEINLTQQQCRIFGKLQCSKSPSALVAQGK